MRAQRTYQRGDTGKWEGTGAAEVGGWEEDRYKTHVMQDRACLLKAEQTQRKRPEVEHR